MIWPRTGGKLDHAACAVGIHHIALWAKSRREVDAFHADFLVKNAVPETETPADYPVYAPGYYAVFFDDPINGIHWELAHTPRLPSPIAYLRWRRALKQATASHPKWQRAPAAAAMRHLPGR